MRSISSISQRPSLKDSSICTLFNEHSTLSSSSPRPGAVRLIPVKSGRPKLIEERRQYHAKRKKELHQRLEWIDNIFGDYSCERRVGQDISRVRRLGARPRSQPVPPSGLPKWILSCSGEEHAPPSPLQKVSRHPCMQRSFSNTAIADVAKQPDFRPRSHQSQRVSTKLNELSGEALPHEERSSVTSAATLPEQIDPTMEWCHNVLRQDFRKHRPALAFTQKEEEGEESTSPSDYTPTNQPRRTCKNYWMMLFGARRFAVRHDFRVDRKGSADVSEISDSLNTLTETEVIELVRWVSKKEMDVLKDLPVLMDMWRIGGYPYGVNPEWLKELAEQENSRAFLDADECLSVWAGYFDKMTDFHNDIFAKAAKGSQAVVESDLPLMFREVGLWPMSGALVESCKRIAPTRRKVKESDGKGITLSDFHKIYNDLYGRAGLTIKEYARVEHLWQQHYPGKTALDVEELYFLLKHVMTCFMLTSHEPPILTEGFLYSLAKEVVIRVRERSLSLNMDSWHHVFEHMARRCPFHDRISGTADMNDFFVACNILHHHLAERVAKTAERIGLDASEKMNKQDILSLFDELGHCSPCLDTFLEEALEDNDLLGREEFTFGEVYTVLMSYVSKDSFSRAQREEIEWLFDVFMTELPDVEKTDDSLRISELKRALRWMCFTPSPHRLTTFMDWCGKSIADYMDFAEFCNIVSNYRHSNIGMARSCFRELEEDDGEYSCTWSDAPLSEFGSMMRLVGHSLTDQELIFLTQSANVIDGRITWREFLRLEEFHRKNIKEGLKNNLGFTAVEVESLANRFNKQKLQGTDFINYVGFSKILPKLIPQMPIDASVRKLIAESDMDGDHHIEFKEFLWIMRRLYDKDGKEEQARDQIAMDELGYTPTDVREMRVLFNMSDKDLSGSLDITEVMKLFSSLVDMCYEAEHELEKYLDQVDYDVNGTLDFWEFLGLMRKLEKNNWRGIVGTAANQVSQLEEIHQKEEAIAAAKQFSNLKTTGLSHLMMI